MSILDQETEIAVCGTAPRITPADLEAAIMCTEIVKHIAPSGQILRWAVLTCRNGFAVAGRPSAAACAENDRPEVGEQIAVENAKSELWGFLGYELKTKLSQRRLTEADAAADLAGTPRPDNPSAAWKDSSADAWPTASPV